METFCCNDCGCKFSIDFGDDPTTSTGCCRGCGGRNWVIYPSPFNIDNKKQTQSEAGK